MPEELTNTPTSLLYIAAIVAYRTRQSEQVEQSRVVNVNVEVDVEITTHALLALSIDEAKQKGHLLALCEWPESEGWRDHTVADLRYMDREYLVDTLLEMDELESPASIEESQMVM